MASNKTITVGAFDTDATVATITLANWKRKTNFLTSSNAISTGQTDRFKFTNDNDGWEKTINSADSGKSAYIDSPIYVTGTAASDSNRVKCTAAGTTYANGATGTKTKPFSKIEEALKDTNIFDDKTAAQTITIDGTAGKQLISQKLSNKFSALTITGTNASKASIDAGGASGAGSALVVNDTSTTAVPITITNLTITGGNTSNGGGISIAAGSVALGSGAKITGNIATQYGGGVHLAGSNSKLFMYGSSVIGDTTTTLAQDGTSSSSTTFANKAAKSGGGIYNDGGAVYIGYSGISSGAPVKADMTSGGGVRRNFAGTTAEGNSGGGIQNRKGTLTIASGSISYNQHSFHGGGIYIAGDAEVNIESPVTSTNKAVFEGNKALVGGAIYNGKKLTMKAGQIGGSGVQNTVAGTGAMGGAIYQAGTFDISGSAVVYAGSEKTNDVYLPSSSYTVGVGTLDSTNTGTVASVSLKDWKRGTNFLSSSSELSDTVKGQFKLTKDDTGWEKSGTTSSGVNYVYITSPIYVVSSSGTPPTGFSNGKTSGANGTKTSPYATISAAALAGDLSNADCKIIVAGTLTGTQTISSVTSGVTAITLAGYDTNATLNGGASGSALTLSAAKSYTIQQLKITNGSYSAGGGININAAATVNLDSGAKVYSNKATTGGKGAGVYVKSGATLNIKNGSEIYSNTAASGTINGAGVYNAGTVVMSGGSIYSNTANLGGAIYNAGTFAMSGGTIGSSTTANQNSASGTGAAGGAIYQNGTFTVSGTAKVYEGSAGTNDVYLPSSSYTVGVGSLSTTGTVAYISLKDWKRGTNFLSSSSALSATVKGQFKLTKDDADWERKDDTSSTTKYVYISSPIYVVSSSGTAPSGFSNGKTSGATGTKTSPYATIAAAAQASDLSKADSKITVVGTLTGTQTISSIADSAVTAVTLAGYDTNATINGNAAGSALTISVAKTFTIQQLKITNGKADAGGGINITAGTVNLDSGAKVYSNKANSGKNGAGIYVKSGATLNIKDGSAIYSNLADSGTIYGGGVYNAGTVDMTGGSIYNNSAQNGGGIYSSGTLYVRGSAIVGDKTETTATGSTAGTYCSNSAIASGGGIYNSGTLYFGCNTSGTKDADSGYALDSGYGVRRNYANDGGGIYNTGTFKSGSGSISYNYAPNSAGGLYAGGSTNNMGGLGVSYNKTGKNGAGVYVASSKSAEVTAQSGVNHNTATASSGSSDVCGGGIYVAGTLTTTEALNANWNSASITGGSGKAYGGCVYIASGGKFVYSKGQLGGTSQSNTVSNTVSGSTDKAYGGSVYQGGTFEVSANGYIPKGSLRSDDVYLPSEKYITVTDVISGNSESSQMTITPATWKRGTQVLAKGGDLSYTNFKNQIVKFKGSETDWLAVYNSYVGKLYTSYKIYVSQSGYDDDKNGLGTSAKPYKTISKAVGECWTTGSDFTVYVSGTIKGAHTIGGTDVTINAKSLTLEGTGTSPTIDAEKTAGIRPLTINTSLGVTIKNLTITKGNVTPNYGGGIYVEGGCALTLDDGASVLSNTASSGGGGVYVDTGSTLIMKSGSTINKNVGNGGGGGVYNKGKVLMSGTARIGANGTSKPGTSSTSPTGNYTGLKGGGIYNAGTVCLGYTAWTNETTNTPKKLEGGVTQNYASEISGGIYVDTAAKVYMKTGNISYNRANNGGGMTNATGTVKLLGGKMESNWADSNKSGAIWQNGDLYLGGDVYIPYGGSLGLNDLYLNDKSVQLNTDIAPPEDCTTGVIATIYPNTYAIIGVVGQNYAYASCLAVVPQASQAWTINTSNGCLKKTTAITSSNISSVVSGLSSGAELKADSTFDNNALETLKTSLGSTSNTIKLDLSQSSVTSLSDANKIPSCLESIVLPNNFDAYGLLWQGLRSNSKLKTIEVSPQNKKLASDSGILYGLDDNGNKVRLVLYPASKTGSSYTLPSGVITLGGGCFWGNKNLTGITNLTQITQIDNYGNQFRLCEKITSINLTNVTTTGDYGYGFIKGCSALTTVTLASTLTTLEGNCFSECPNLTTIHFKSTTPPTINTSDPKLFSDCNASLMIYVPSSSRSAWLNATGTKGFANSACNALAGSLSSKVYGE